MNTEWKLVPVEPTDEMVGAAFDLFPLRVPGYVNGNAARCAIYAAMLNAAPPAPTSHPIPTGATGDRDWELSCDECNGSGHVFVKHQVAERKTDVQEFKEECEACEGRGFNIAFEDIPGIAEYVKSCRAAPSVPVDAQGDDSDIPELRSEAEIAFEGWLTREMPGGTIISNPAWWAPRILLVAKWILRAKGDLASAPAAGDALADPALQKLFGEAITGALAFGAQGVNPPPEGHWLAPFWNMARADAALAADLALLDHPLLRDVLGYIEDAGPADVWSAAQSRMGLRDTALAAQRKGES